MSLAHEIYHLLVDGAGHEPLATISGYLNDVGLDRERRANAFAVRLLCPESKVRALARAKGLSPEDAARRIERYGLSYAALRLYLRNEASLELPPNPPPSLLGLGSEPRWIHAEEPAGVAGFPLPEVPTERRTKIAQLASRLYSMGELRRDAFAAMLGVTPAADVERVLSFFALDPPRDDS